MEGSRMGARSSARDSATRFRDRGRRGNSGRRRRPYPLRTVMITNSDSNGFHSHDRRRFPRYYVTSRLTLAIEDESQKESLGLGEPQDISLGGVRVANLPSGTNVKIGDQLGLLLLDGEDA